jgi:Flp pilus assembly pilin Flp
MAFPGRRGGRRDVQDSSKPRVRKGVRVVFHQTGKSVICDENGQTIVEYALVVATIAIASTGVLAAMAGNIHSVFQTLSNAL